MRVDLILQGPKLGPLSQPPLIIQIRKLKLGRKKPGQLRDDYQVGLIAMPTLFHDDSQ